MPNLGAAELLVALVTIALLGGALFGVVFLAVRAGNRRAK